MPGALIVKPIEGKFKKNLDLFGKMDPYCTVFVGDQIAKGEVCKRGGKTPHWSDTISIPRAADEPVMYVELKDQDIFKSDDLIGVCQVDLNSIPDKTSITNWFPVFNKKEIAGEVLLEITYKSNHSCQGGMGDFAQPGYNQATYPQPSYNQSNYTQPQYTPGRQCTGHQITPQHHHHHH